MTSRHKTVEELLAEVSKLGLPTTVGAEGDDESDDDDGPCPEVFQSGHHWDDLEDAIVRGEAYDIQLQKWQDEEALFFKQHGRWKTMELGEMTKEDVAILLDTLELGAFKSQFRRTDGRLLNNMTREDVVRRFGDSVQAAEVLWEHMEKAKLMFGPLERETGSVASRLPPSLVGPMSAPATRTSQIDDVLRSNQDPPDESENEVSFEMFKALLSNPPMLNLN